MKDYTIFNGKKLDGDVRQELEKKDEEIISLKNQLSEKDKQYNEANFQYNRVNTELTLVKELNPNLLTDY